MSEPATARTTQTRAARRETPEPGRRRHVHRRARVAVVERHALVAEAVGLTFNDSFEAIPVPLTQYRTTAAAREAILRSRADVAVLILSPDWAVDTLGLVEQLSEHDISVLVTSDHLDLDTAYDYLCAGAVAYWHRGGVAAVVQAVSREAARRAWQTPTDRLQRSRAVRPPANDSHLDDDARIRRDLARLTATESRILRAMMRGKCADDIAREHVVSVRTVRTQIKVVLGKLGARSQLSAVALAWRVGWRPEADLSST